MAAGDAGGRLDPGMTRAAQVADLFQAFVVATVRRATSWDMAF